jgi:beta-galactosidase
VKSDGWETRSFSFEPVRGKRKVSFVFLPGSRFDFASFRFGRSGHP